MNKKIVQALMVFGVAFTAHVGVARAERFECTPTEAIEFTDRIHVACSAPVRMNNTDIWFVAIPSGSASAARFVSIAEAAILSGRKVLFDTTPSAPTPNPLPSCNSVNCRLVSAFGFR